MSACSALRRGESNVDEQLENALREAIAFLNAQGYRYAVVGGIANQIWGEARFTYDVDLKVQVPAVDYPTVRAAIRSAFPEPARPHAPPNPLIVAVKITRWLYVAIWAVCKSGYVLQKT